MKKKVIALVLVCVLVFGIAVGGTLAWLMDKTNTVINTFTVGDVDIDLTETTGDKYNMVPGVDITKDPTVTVKGGSETCYVFVKVEEVGNYTVSETKILNYEIDSSWTLVPETTNVYYQVVGSSVNDKKISVIKGNTISVASTLTKNDLAEAKENNPYINVTAYAVQQAQMADVNAAWNQVKTLG